MEGDLEEDLEVISHLLIRWVQALQEKVREDRHFLNPRMEEALAAISHPLTVVVLLGNFSHPLTVVVLVAISHLLMAEVLAAGLVAGLAGMADISSLRMVGGFRVGRWE